MGTIVAGNTEWVKLSGKTLAGKGKEIEVAGNDVTIDLSEGDNKVSVASGVSGFTAKDLAAGDSISGLSGTGMFANNSVIVGSVTGKGIAAPAAALPAPRRARERIAAPLPSLHSADTSTA